MTAGGEERLAFEAEVSRLLDIVAHSLYSHREVFLRELLSNAADACDRLRYLAVTEPDLIAGEPDFRIEIALGDKALIVEDNGIGMNRAELASNLGTIARSGTAAFLGELGDKKREVDLIGRFGVGFYAAFMVAERVTVDSRRAGEAQGWRWSSDGRGSYTLAECAEAPRRGTRVRLELKEDAREFLDPGRIKSLVRTYSDHLSVPIELAGERLNSAGALWQRPKGEIEERQYLEFYHHVAHAIDEPWARLHWKAEGVMEYSGLLFIPSEPPFDLFDPARASRVRLYVKRVFVTESSEALLPPYLRFLRGIIDSEDLPLNISRETLQANPMIARMRQAIVKRVLGELEARARASAEDYAGFWETFGAVLKEGLYEDPGQRDSLLKLARFRSTAVEGWTSLAEYLTRLKEGQEAIYYITGEEIERLGRSPQLEGFRARGLEVLLLTDPVDEFWVPSVGAFEGKPFRSATRAAADLTAFAPKSGSAVKDTAQQPALATLVAVFKSTLGEAVKDVRLSSRLTESAVCLAAEEGDLDLHLARMLKRHQQMEEVPARILEVNPDHPLILRLAEAVKAGGEGVGARVGEAAELLLDQALIQEGEAPRDAVRFAARLTALVESRFA